MSTFSTDKIDWHNILNKQYVTVQLSETGSRGPTAVRGRGTGSRAPSGTGSRAPSGTGSRTPSGTRLVPSGKQDKVPKENFMHNIYCFFLWTCACINVKTDFRCVRICAKFSIFVCLNVCYAWLVRFLFDHLLSKVETLVTVFHTIWRFFNVLPTAEILFANQKRWCYSL